MNRIAPRIRSIALAGAALATALALSACRKIHGGTITIHMSGNQVKILGAQDLHVN